MSPLDREIVRRKLETITTSLRLLEPLRDLELDDYMKDVYRRKAAERLLQEVVEAAVDINAHMLVQAGRGAPDDLHASFVDMAGAGLLPADLGRELAPSAGLRNRLVHEYDRIDDGIVLGAIGAAVDLYARYVSAVQAALNSAEKE